MSASNKYKISNLEIYGNYHNLPEFAKKERDAAIDDLTHHATFRPVNDDHGPYDVSLSIEENRLVIRTSNENKEDLPLLALSLSPYRRIIQDYFLMIESYEKARITATREKLEAIDMGRRGLHNEGAELLQNRLKDKIEIDFNTARRLFTLICVLHTENVKMLAI